MRCLSNKALAGGGMTTRMTSPCAGINRPSWAHLHTSSINLNTRIHSPPPDHQLHMETTPSLSSSSSSSFSPLEMIFVPVSWHRHVFTTLWSFTVCQTKCMWPHTMTTESDRDEMFWLLRKCDLLLNNELCKVQHDNKSSEIRWFLCNLLSTKLLILHKSLIYCTPIFTHLR